MCYPGSREIFHCIHAGECFNRGMKVFLLRHATASYGPPDPDRPLTGEGSTHAHKLAAFIQDNPFYDFSEIWCSPYLRARQTAAPFMDGINGKIPLVEMDCLTPFGDPEDLIPRLLKTPDSILIVGHNPHLSILSSMLLGLRNSAACIPFKKCGMMIFKRDNFNETGFSLAGYLTPNSIGLKS